jgi:hypothetical protein
MPKEPNFLIYRSQGLDTNVTVALAYLPSPHEA